MSAKRFDPLVDPSNVSSSEEEDEEVVRESSEEEEEDDEEEEEEDEEEDDDDFSSRNPTVKKPETEKKQVSDSESGSDEETGSESETEIKSPVKNPEPSVVKNQDSKKAEPSATKKRSSEADASIDAKRVKKVSGEDEKKSKSVGGGEEMKKYYFQRVWSEEDEIALLQGIIDYNNDTGSSPYDDKNVFYELVKKSISFDVSKTQFMEKLRSLKKKFENNLGKGKKKNGEDPAFTKPHDRKAFELSKFVWGVNGILALESSAVKSNVKQNKSKKVETVLMQGQHVESVKKPEFVSIVESVARFGVDDLTAQQGWSRLASEDKKRFEDQWKELQLREFRFFSQKSGFIHQVVTKMAEAFKQNP